jgi:hypothetical protein
MNRTLTALRMVGVIAAAFSASACQTNANYACDQARNSDPFRTKLVKNRPELPFLACDSTTTDLNRDGLIDFTAADHKNPGFGFYMNEGGSFSDGHEVTFDPEKGGSNSAGIVAADFNADGWMDIGNSNHNGTITVRMNNTKMGEAVASFPVGAETTIKLDLDHSDAHGFAGLEGGLAAADFDGDGRLDIATANLSERKTKPGAFTATVLLNETKGENRDASGNVLPLQMGEPQYVGIPSGAISLTAKDLNADGKPDLAVAVTLGSQLSILQNSSKAAGEVSFNEPLNLQIPKEMVHGGKLVENPAGAGPTNAVTGKFTDDDRPDIATANWNVDTIAIFRNTTPNAGDPISFDSEPLQVIRLCFNPVVVRAGDIDGDGDDDLVVVPLDVQQTVAFAYIKNRTGDPDGNPQAPLELVRTVNLPEDMHPTQEFLTWLRGKSTTGSPGTWFNSVGNLADFDGDGDLDVGIVAAKASLGIGLQPLLTGTTDIMSFVDPAGPTALAKSLMPKQSRLVHYETSHDRARAPE